MKAWEYRLLGIEERIFSRTMWRGKCLEFNGSTVDGYGRVKLHGKSQLVHRLVWSFKNGEIPDGYVIMHTCDNPRCVEIEHLQLGTQPENIADMTRKGRRVSAVGTKTNKAKLCENDIPIIRHWLAENHEPYKIANKFGVTEALIRHIRNGKAWRHVQAEAA